MRTGRRSGAKSKVDRVTGTSGTLCELPKWSPHLTRQNERCHENASDCLRLDRCGGDAGDTSTCLLLTRLPSRRTMPGVLRSVPAILRSAPAILWSIALLRSVPAILRSAPAILWSATRLLRLGQPNHSVDFSASDRAHNKGSSTEETLEGTLGKPDTIPRDCPGHC
jgi:hypothetical protein